MLGGRRIGLHLDTRGLAWATIASGRAGDEVWLDRSWDEGATWPGGSSLGRTAVPAGATGTRTTMVNTRDPRSRLYGGAVRACGRAVEGANGSCTAWARPADRPRRRSGGRAHVRVPAGHRLVAVELVEQRRRGHHADGLDGAHRPHRPPLGRGPHVRGQPRHVPGRCEEQRPDRGQLHQPRDRRRRVVGGRLDPRVRPHRRAQVSRHGGHDRHVRARLLGHRPVRRRSVVGPRAHVQECGHQRALHPARGRAAQPPARATRCGWPGRAPAGTGSAAAA